MFHQQHKTSIYRELTGDTSGPTTSNEAAIDNWLKEALIFKDVYILDDIFLVDILNKVDIQILLEEQCGQMFVFEILSLSREMLQGWQFKHSFKKTCTAAASEEVSQFRIDYWTK